MGVVKRSVKAVLSQFDWGVDNWKKCIAPCLVGLRFYQHNVLGVAPFTVCTGLLPRLPIKQQPVAQVQEFRYDENVAEAYVNELISYMTWLCKQVVSKLSA